MGLFDKTKNKINNYNYVSSVEGDINSIENKFSRFIDDFGTGKNLSNLFDQRISDGLSDLISGVTGIRTSNIPEIRDNILKAQEDDRVKRQDALSKMSLGGKGYEAPENRTVLRYPEILDQEKDAIGSKIPSSSFANYIHFSTIPRRHAVHEDNPDLKGEHYDIFLHLPDAIQDNLTVGFKETSADILSRILVGWFGINSSSKEYEWNMDDIYQAFINMAPGTDLIRQGMGQVENPLKYQLFEGVNFRTYNYTFTLRPKNAAESRTIRQMIHAFKKMSLPGTQGPNKSIYTLPNEWSITYDGIVQNWLDFPLTSVITGVEVDHTGGQGYVATHDGASSAITLSLSFTETVTLYRQRYAEEVSAYSGSVNKRKSTNHQTTSVNKDAPEENADDLLETMHPSVVAQELKE